VTSSRASQPACADWTSGFGISDERRDESHWVIGHAAVVKRFLLSQE